VLSFGVSRMVAHKKTPGAGGEATSHEAAPSERPAPREGRERSETTSEEEVIGDSLDSLPLAPEKKKKKAHAAVAAEASKPPSGDLESALDHYRASHGQAPATTEAREAPTDEVPEASGSPSKASSTPAAGEQPPAPTKPAGDPEDCLTPTYVDDDGIRHIKKHCL